MPLAGQIIRAADFDGITPTAYVQGNGQTVTSSTTLVDSAIVVPIDGPTIVQLHMRFQTAGGGIRWAWRETGTVTTELRSILAAGRTTTGSNTDIASMALRAVATANEVQPTAQYQNSTTHLIRETLFLGGAGSIVFQFAQETSNAGGTTLIAAARATAERYSIDT